MREGVGYEIINFKYFCIDTVYLTNKLADYFFTLFDLAFKKNVGFLWEGKGCDNGESVLSDSGSSVHLLLVHFRLYIYL